MRFHFIWQNLMHRRLRDLVNILPLIRNTYNLQFCYFLKLVQMPSKVFHLTHRSRDLSRGEKNTVVLLYIILGLCVSCVSHIRPHCNPVQGRTRAWTGFSLWGNYHRKKTCSHYREPCSHCRDPISLQGLLTTLGHVYLSPYVYSLPYVYSWG